MWYTMSMRRRGTGLVLDPKDERDSLFGAHYGGEVPPGFATVRVAGVRTRNQGRSNACVGFAIGKALEVASHHQLPQPWPEISPLAIYSPARLYHAVDADGDGDIDYDDLRDKGTYIRAGMKAVMRMGAAAESTCPFSILRINKPIPFGAMRDGLRRRGLRKYFRVSSAREARVALGRKMPIVGGWEMREGWAKGPEVLKEDWGKVVGRHAMVVETCHEDGSFDIWNTSWTDRFGLRGRVRVSEAVFEKGMDLWAIAL